MSRFHSFIFLSMNFISWLVSFLFCFFAKFCFFHLIWWCCFVSFCVRCCPLVQVDFIDAHNHQRCYDNRWLEDWVSGNTLGPERSFFLLIFAFLILFLTKIAVDVCFRWVFQLLLWCSMMLFDVFFKSMQFALLVIIKSRSYHVVSIKGKHKIQEKKQRKWESAVIRQAARRQS